MIHYTKIIKLLMSPLTFKCSTIFVQTLTSYIENLLDDYLSLHIYVCTLVCSLRVTLRELLLIVI